LVLEIRVDDIPIHGEIFQNSGGHRRDLVSDLQITSEHCQILVAVELHDPVLGNHELGGLQGVLDVQLGIVVARGAPQAGAWG
jgi:hypothetical protein